MYSHSKKWVSDKQKARDNIKNTNKSRHRMFPKSCAWTVDLDLDFQRREMAKLRVQKDYSQIMDEIRERTILREYDLQPPPPMKQAMRAEAIMPGSDFDTNHSAVLAQPTVFVHTYWKSGRPTAPWPCREELFHEGDHRISNEKHLRRMLPAPRMSANETVAWSMRAYLTPSLLDDFRINRNGMEAVEEFDEDEAIQSLGSDLLAKLDPVGRL